jgi:hypothetical protein
LQARHGRVECPFASTVSDAKSSGARARPPHRPAVPFASSVVLRTAIPVLTSGTGYRPCLRPCLNTRVEGDDVGFCEPSWRGKSTVRLERGTAPCGNMRRWALCC